MSNMNKIQDAKLSSIRELVYFSEELIKTFLTLEDLRDLDEASIRDLDKVKAGAKLISRLVYDMQSIIWTASTQIDTLVSLVDKELEPPTPESEGKENERD